MCRVHLSARRGAAVGEDRGGQPVPRETATWLSGIGDKLRDRLAKVGLIEPQRRLTVGEFLDQWLATKEAMKHAVASLVAWGQSVKEMKELFDNGPLVALTHSDADRYRKAMQDRQLRDTTVNKRLGHARQMLEDAVRLGHLTTNPWEHVRQRQGDPSERRAHVPVADALQVIDRCPNVWWKLLVALARFGGLRTPSEPFSVTWADVDWERGRPTVPSPKTKSSGKAHRVIPMFPLLRPHLEAAFEAAVEGSVYVFPKEYRRRAQGPRGFVNANLRTTLGKVIRRAGVSPWPRLWHSLRASCESDLAQTFPLATVTRWLGNTPSVALRHYVDPTDAAFEKARGWTPSGAETGARVAHNPAQQAAAANRTNPQHQAQNEEPQG